VVQILRLEDFPDGEPSEEQIVQAWWRRSELLHGVDRDPVGAEALDWSEQAVCDVVAWASADDAIAMLGDLLAADGADPSIVGCNPLERLLGCPSTRQRRCRILPSTCPDEGERVAAGAGVAEDVPVTAVLPPPELQERDDLADAGDGDADGSYQNAPLPSSGTYIGSDRR